MSNIYGKRQKCRSFVKFKYPTFRFGNISVFALSSGYLNFRMVSNFFIRFKKIFKFYKSLTKFWYNLYCSYIITKKALNVRMGKGKGSRKGRVCYVKSGVSMIELNYCRLGILLYLFKYIKVRCSFKLSYFYKRVKKFSSSNQLVKYRLINKKNKFRKIKNKFFIRKRIGEVIRTYKSTKRISRTGAFSILIKRYFSKFYYKKYSGKYKVVRPFKNYLYYTKKFRYFRFFIRKRTTVAGGYFFFLNKYHYNHLFNLERKFYKLYLMKLSRIKARGLKQDLGDLKRRRSFVLSWVELFLKRKFVVPLGLFRIWGYSNNVIAFHKKNKSISLLIKKILSKKKLSMSKKAILRRKQFLRAKRIKANLLKKKKLLKKKQSKKKITACKWQVYWTL